MKENKNSELPKVKKTASPEQKKTTPPTSQAKSNTSQKKPTNTSLSTSQKSAPRKRVRPLQTIGQTQRSRDEILDEALDEAYDEFIEADLPPSEEIPIDAPEVIQQKKRSRRISFSACKCAARHWQKRR